MEAGDRTGSVVCEVSARRVHQPAPRSLRFRCRRTALACKEIRPMTDSLFSVADRVVLVTGGSRGLGRAMCVGLAERGARVVIASRKLDACEELAAQIRGSGGDAFASACHVGNWETLDQVVADAAGRWGRLDGLVNNAGMSPLAPSLLENSETLIDKMIRVKL